MYSIHPLCFETGKGGHAFDQNMTPMECKVHWCGFARAKRRFLAPTLTSCTVCRLSAPKTRNAQDSITMTSSIKELANTKLQCVSRARAYTHTHAHTHRHTHTPVESLMQTVLLRACSDSQTLTLTVTWKSHRTAKLKCATSIYGVTS